ncbi:uncharacterized protein EV422DRAFT_527288 [Fimicolochytrium jonesii]|uniref:uncharacterized protein n=1 Tax=Fimicolochytrium jonesii TaxID=1396493 RepID=UPI0022FF1740|nr:uncharacterized protein EV422DRAFT_527288 [Fimicolochytrium jonesii]KAI8821853.1 hypothetical protein EV422DRAFT_527288 [Fimicolochytrium jonesii]
MDIVNAAMGGAASNLHQAANTVHASTPAHGGGTPLMALASYMMYSEAALILLLSVPIYIPYRRQLMEWLHYSPSLWTFRVIIVCIHAFVGILLADTYLRLNRISLQIEGIQAAHAQVMTGGAAIPGATPGYPSAATMAPPIDASGNVSNLNDLFSAKFRGQRDFYVLAFTLFCSAVLLNLHMVLIKMDKFRAQRNDLKQKLNALRSFPASSANLIDDGAPAPSVTETAANQANKVATGITSTVKNATNIVADKMDSLLHHRASQPEIALGTAPVAQNIDAVAAPAESVVQRTTYVVPQEL